MKFNYESPIIKVIAIVLPEIICQSPIGAQTEPLEEQNFDW